MLYPILTFFLVVIIGGLLYLSTLEGEYSIRHSQLIDAEINSVFEKIRDFKTWPEWSPWIIHEPETVLEYSENYNDENGYYTWQGQHIGAGKLTHIAINPLSNITQRLEFTKPFKAICEVGFEFSQNQGKTKIVWFMHGKMPFLFRFMTEKTKKMISKDYALGLAMLNGILDKNAKYPELQFLGEIVREPVYAICQGFSGGVEAMETTMKQSFPQLMTYVAEQQGQTAGAPFTAYHQSNPETMQFVCDIAVPVTEGIDPGEYQLKSLAGGRYYKVTLKGDYQFLELVWYSAIGHIKMLKLKYDTSRPSLEVYENDPEQVENSNDWLTTLYIPCK